MIEIFIGDDTQKARKAMREAVGFALRDSGATSAERFTDVSFDPSAAREAIFAQSLFGEKNTLIFDGTLDAKEAEEFYFADISTSPNNIFIRETAPNKDVLEILHKIGTVKEFKKFKKIPETNFPLVDAVSARDKKTAWALYVRAKERGSVAEELHGLLFWGTKLLYICANETKEEAIKAGVTANNYQRYLANSKKYLGNDLADRLRILRDMYHKAHRGEGDFDAMLEQYILKI
jgi:DNA polymerase III delta subunit